MIVVLYGDIWWYSFVVTILLSLVWVGQMSRAPDVPPNFLVPAGRLHPNRTIERDFELFNEFALFAIDKWYQLPANSSVRRIQQVYWRLLMCGSTSSGPGCWPGICVGIFVEWR
jgi:hypothetical protein